MLIHLAPGAVAWPAAIMVWGPGFITTPHRHHCVQLLMTLRGSLLARAGPEEEWMTADAALVRPDAIHQADARGTTLLVGFLDAESEEQHALNDRALPGTVGTCEDGQWSQLEINLGYN